MEHLPYETYPPSRLFYQDYPRNVIISKHWVLDLRPDDDYSLTPISASAAISRLEEVVSTYKTRICDRIVTNWNVFDHGGMGLYSATDIAAPLSRKLS